MLARDLMTTDVVTVSPDTAVNEVARLLLDRGISAAPVVDAAGTAIGMVSEGDLIGRDDKNREAGRDWWLILLAKGEELLPDFLQRPHPRHRVARDVMVRPVVSVTEATEATEIARILTTHRVKRVPVVRDGHVIGIVSRADLLRTLAAGRSQPLDARAQDRPNGAIVKRLAAVDHPGPAGHGDHAASSTAPRAASAVTIEDEPTVADFRDLVAGFEHKKAERLIDARNEAVKGRRDKVKELIGLHFTDESWQLMIRRAREAAEHGQKEFMMLRFPSTLCIDGGRAVNAPLPNWPETLRGEADEIYLRWKRDLQSRGFHLIARVLDFPGGFPGDIGLFLVWDA